MVITLLMKILFIICHVPSSLFSYFLFVFVLFAPILVCLSIIIIIIIKPAFSMLKRALCRPDDAGNISRDPHTKLLRTRRERLAKVSKPTRSYLRTGI